VVIIRHIKISGDLSIAYYLNENHTYQNLCINYILPTKYKSFRKYGGEEIMINDTRLQTDKTRQHIPRVI
jgi:hypothetical protein